METWVIYVAFPTAEGTVYQRFNEYQSWGLAIFETAALALLMGSDSVRLRREVGHGG